MDIQNVETVLIIGSGVMGHSIAQIFATAEMDVNLVDVDQKVLGRAMSLIESSLGTMAEYGKIPGNKIPSILARIHPSINLAESVEQADFIIEVVPEVPKIKEGVYAQLDKLCSEDMVIASNTSGLNIFDIANVKNPERLVITHFFAPPHIIPLVEVVPGPRTSYDTVSFAVEILEKVGKSPVVLKEFIPSFIVNRIQNAIGGVVQEMLEKGWASPEDIDRAVKLSLGVRLPIVGVVQTADFNGLDLVCDIMRSFGKESSFFNRLVEQGRLGVKTSKGIYDYGNRTESEILKKRDMLFLQLLNYLEEIKAFDPV
jgi:3-hydroxybutyryl-CoA dehydrogenase